MCLNHPETHPLPPAQPHGKSVFPETGARGPRGWGRCPRDPLGLALPRGTTQPRCVCAAAHQSLTPAFPFVSSASGDPQAATLAPQALLFLWVTETQAWRSEADASINYLDSGIYSRSGSILKGERLELVTLTKLCRSDSRKWEEKPGNLWRKGPQVGDPPAGSAWWKWGILMILTSGGGPGKWSRCCLP